MATTGRTGHSTGRFGRGSGWLKGAGAVLVAAVLAVAVGGFGLPGSSKEGSAAEGPVGISALPPQVAITHRLILAGGPFPYPKDGSVFGNREHLLPERSRGHYREYTVESPQSRDRGARRIVCGGFVPTAPDACYYTDDHYASFRLIAQ